VAYIFSLMTFQVNRVGCDHNAGHAAAFIHLIRVDAVGHTVCLIYYFEKVLIIQMESNILHFK